jgi:hypothetical protein
VAALIFFGWLASGCVGVGEATVPQIGESGGHWDPCPSLLDGDTAVASLLTRSGAPMGRSGVESSREERIEESQPPYMSASPTRYQIVSVSPLST